MPAEIRVLGDMVNDHGRPAFTDLVTDSGRDLQFAAWLQAELDVVLDAAGDSAISRDPRDRGEAHPSRLANDVKDGRDSGDARDREEIGLNRVPGGRRGCGVAHWMSAG